MGQFLMSFTREAQEAMLEQDIFLRGSPGLWGEHGAMTLLDVCTQGWPLDLGKPTQGRGPEPRAACLRAVRRTGLSREQPQHGVFTSGGPQVGSTGGLQQGQSGGREGDPA